MKRNNNYSEFFSTATLLHDLKRTSIRSGVYAFASGGINLFLRVGSISILARILMPEHFGLLSMVTAITAIAVQFKDMGLSIATVQQKEITHAQVSTLFWINFTVGLLITIILCALSKTVAWFYNDSRLVWITVAIATNFFWSGMTIQHQALLRRKLKYLEISLISIGANIFGIVVAIVLAVKGYGYWALVWRELAGGIFTAIATLVACPWTPGPPKRKAGIGRMLRFGGDLTGFNIITYLTDNLDQILLGKFRGPSILGIYRQACYLAKVPFAQVTNPIQTIGQSTLSALQDDELKFRRYYSRMLTLLTFVTMPSALFFFIYSKDVILLLLGEKWIEAHVIFRIFALASFIRPAVSTTGLVLITCGKSKKYFVLGVANSIMIIFSIVIGLKWGMVGVATGHVIENYIVFLPIISVAFRNTPISVGLFFRSILPSVMSSFLMGCVLFWFCRVVHIESSLNAIIASLPIAVAAYLLIWVMIPGGNVGLKELFGDFAFLFRKAES